MRVFLSYACERLQFAEQDFGILTFTHECMYHSHQLLRDFLLRDPVNNTMNGLSSRWQISLATASPSISGIR